MDKFVKFFCYTPDNVLEQNALYIVISPNNVVFFLDFLKNWYYLVLVKREHSRFSDKTQL